MRFIDKYYLKVVFPGHTARNNSNQGRSWKSQIGLRKKYRQEIVQIIGHRGPEAPLTKFRLKLTRYSTRLMDYDNLLIGFKSLIDGLADAGVIEDDAPKYQLVSPELFQVKSKEKKMILEIIEL